MYDSLHKLSVILWWKRSNNKVYIVLGMKYLLVEKSHEGWSALLMLFSRQLYTSSITDPTILYRCLDISTILQNMIYILPVEIFDKRRKQGVRRVDRRKSKQARRAGNGLEIVPCVYRLYGAKAYVDRMEEISDSTTSSGLI